MRLITIATVGTVLSLSLACDTNRVAKLEKDNLALRAQVQKLEQQPASLDLQAKCSKDAKQWFVSNWQSSPDPNTILLTFINHYNSKQNKCFILVEYHYKLDE